MGIFSKKSRDDGGRDNGPAPSANDNGGNPYAQRANAPNGNPYAQTGNAQKGNPYAQQPNGNPYARQAANSNAFGSNEFGSLSRSDSDSTVKSGETLPPYSATNNPPQYQNRQGPAPNGARYPGPQGQGLPSGPRAGGPNGNASGPVPNRYGVPEGRPGWGVPPQPGFVPNSTRDDSLLFGGAAQRGRGPANEKPPNYAQPQQQQPGPRRPGGPPAGDSGLFGGAAQRQPGGNGIAPPRPGAYGGPGSNAYGGPGANAGGDGLLGNAAQRAAPPSYNPSGLSNGEPPSAEDEEQRQLDSIRSETRGVMSDSTARTDRMVAMLQDVADRQDAQNDTIHRTQMSLLRTGELMNRAAVQIEDSGRGVKTLTKYDKYSMFRPVHDSRKKAQAKDDQQFAEFQQQNEANSRLAAQRSEIESSHDAYLRNRSAMKLKLESKGPSAYDVEDSEDEDEDADDGHKNFMRGEKGKQKHNLEKVSGLLGYIKSGALDMNAKLDKEDKSGLLDNTAYLAQINHEKTFQVNQQLKKLE